MLDWENREVVEALQLNILKLTEFLNKFGALGRACLSEVRPGCLTQRPRLSADLSTRYRLATINERIASIERSVEHVELALAASRPPGPAHGR